MCRLLICIAAVYASSMLACCGKDVSSSPAAFALMAHYSPGPVAANSTNRLEVKGAGVVGNLKGAVGNLTIGPHSELSPSTSGTDTSSSRGTPRRVAKLETMIREGKEAQEFKSRAVDASKWLRTYICNRWGQEATGCGVRSAEKMGDESHAAVLS